MPQATNLRRFWPVLLLALLPLIPLWRCVFLGEAIGLFDQIRQMAPWNGAKPSQPWDVLQADGVLQFYPWRDLVLKAWGSGHMPLWNPYELAGTPLLANSQSAGFYPPHVLLGLLHFPTALAMTLLAWFHLFWAGLGTYFLARRFGSTKTGAAIAGASFQLSAFMLSWTGLPSVISTVSWIPWMLGFIVLIFGNGSRLTQPRTAPPDGRGVIRAFCGAAVCCGMMILAGHLQFVAYGVMGAVVLTVCLTIQVRGPGVWKKLVGAALAVGLGFVLAAPQLLPVLNYSQFSHRKNTPTPEGYAGYNASAIQPFELVGLAYPQLLGYPERPIKVEGAEAELPGFWPAFTKRGSNYAEVAIGIGPLVLFLLLASRKRDLAARGPILAVGILGLLMAIGTPINWLLYNFVPGWSSTGSPGRAEALFVLAACVAASAAFNEETASEPEGRRRFTPFALLGVITGLSLSLVVQFPKSLPLLGSTADISAIAMDSVRYPVLVCIAAAMVVALAAWIWIRSGRKDGRPLIGAVVLCALIAPSFNLRTGSPDLLTSGPKDERVAVINSGWGLQTAAAALLPPNTGSLSGVHELGGYDSLMHRETVALVKDICGADPFPEANGNMMFVKPSADAQMLADAGVSEVWSLKPLPNLGEPQLMDAGFAKYRLNGPGRVSTPSGAGKVLSESPSSLTVSATGPGRLVVRDRNMPGWMAKVDGKHVSLAGTLWREVDLPAGEHTVVFNYVPPGMMTGLIMGFPAWLIVGGAVLLSQLRKRRVADRANAN